MRATRSTTKRLVQPAAAGSTGKSHLPANAAVAAAAATLAAADKGNNNAQLLLRAASAAAKAAATADTAADAAGGSSREVLATQNKGSSSRGYKKPSSNSVSDVNAPQQPVSRKRAPAADDSALEAGAAAAVTAALAAAPAPAGSGAGTKAPAVGAPAAPKRRRRTPAGTRAGAAVAAAAGCEAVEEAGSSSAAAAAAAASAVEVVATDTVGCATGLIPLLDLGELVVGEVVKRPSATVKTPYVADVRLGNGAMVLAHTPALDCAGMVVPGAHVHMTANAPKGEGQKETKTSHAVQITEEQREDGQVAVVGAHPFLAEKLAAAAVQRHLLPLPPALQRYSSVLKQQKAGPGNGRFDFALCYDDGSRLLIEVKNVVCADYPEGQVPQERSKVGVYTSPAVPYSRTAIFPHGAVKKGVGVVSDRAIKHLHELTQLQLAGRDEQGRPVKCAVLFVVNRSDCAAFRPCHEADMMFARMVQRAQQAGVLVMAHDICWQQGKALWGKALPVVFGPCVCATDVDEQQLKAVLEFNATDPRTHWKKGKQKGK